MSPPHRILIVDDQPTNVLLLAEALGGGYDVRIATDGAQALVTALEVLPSLILLDVVMPGLDGFEVLRRLRQEAPLRNVPVIFVTAANDVEDEERGFALGAVDYITKPISPPIVRARVRTHIELWEQRDRLERQASQDGLTGIANRRFVEQELARLLQERRPFTVALIDVDFFKQYNDRYGHAAGDDCLRKVAGLLAATFPSPGVPARFGGEEFMVLLPGVAGDGAAAPAEALLRGLRQLALPHSGSAVAPHVTVSMGLVSVGGRPIERDRVVETADRLLYEAKVSGRDRAIHLDLATGVTSTLLARP